MRVISVILCFIIMCSAAHADLTELEQAKLDVLSAQMTALKLQADIEQLKAEIAEREAQANEPEPEPVVVDENIY